MPILIFKRTEKKYLLTAAEYEMLMARIGNELTPDAYAKSTVVSLYLDTPDYRMIRSSIDAVSYKEKLRVRCYGVPSGEDRVFLEIKKKYEGVVYKRRVALPHDTVMRYLADGVLPQDSQIMREIDWTRHQWSMPQPAAMIAYEREAYIARYAPGVRLTFDTGVRFRTDELLLTKGHAGEYLLPHGTVLLEIKTDGAMPLSFAHALDACGIFPAKFSKYGNAYAVFSQKQTDCKGEICYA